MHRSRRAACRGVLLFSLLLLLSGCAAGVPDPSVEEYSGNITVAEDYRAVEFPFDAETLTLCGLSLGSAEEAGVLLREYSRSCRSGECETERTERVDGLFLGTCPVTDCRVLRRSGELRSISLSVRYPDSHALESGDFLPSDLCTDAILAAVCGKITRAGFVSELLEKDRSVCALFFLRDGVIVSTDAVQGYDPLTGDVSRLAPMCEGADAVLSLRWIRNDAAEFDQLFRVSPDQFAVRLLYCDEIPGLKGGAA